MALPNLNIMFLRRMHRVIIARHNNILNVSCHSNAIKLPASEMKVSSILYKLEKQSAQHEMHVQRGTLTDAIDYLQTPDEFPNLETIMENFGKREMHLTNANWNRLAIVCASRGRPELFVQLVANKEGISPGNIVYIMRYYEDKGKFEQAIKIASETATFESNGSASMRFKRDWLR